MAFVVFRFQSLVDTDIDPYCFGKMGESLASGHGFAGLRNAPQPAGARSTRSSSAASTGSSVTTPA